LSRCGLRGALRKMENSQHPTNYAADDDEQAERF